MKKIKLWQIIILIFALTFVNIHPALIYASQLEVDTQDVSSEAIEDEVDIQSEDAPQAEASDEEQSIESQEGEGEQNPDEQVEGEDESAPLGEPQAEDDIENPDGDVENPDGNVENPDGEEVIEDEETPQGPVDGEIPPSEGEPVDGELPPVDEQVDPNAPSIEEPVDPNAPPVDPNAPPVDPVVDPTVPVIGGGGVIIPPIIAIPGEEIIVTKTADKDQVNPGETINYTIEVTNNSGGDLTGLTVEDPMINLIETFDLLTGETKVFTGSFEVKKPEPIMVAGEEIITAPEEPPVITNTVRVYGTGPVGEINKTATVVVNGVLEEVLEVMSEEFIEDPGEIYLDLSEFDSQPMMRSFQMMTVNPYENDHLSIDKTATTLDLEERMYQVDFEITGTPPEKPVDVILVIDTSGSMGTRIPGDSKAPLYYAKLAAINFANSIIDENPDSRVGVIEFSGGYYGYASDASTVINLTNNKANLASSINGLTTHNMTNIQAGFRLAYNKISAISSTRDSVKSVVFLTDGVANVSIGNWSSSNPVVHNTHTIAAYTEGQSLYSYINGNLFTIGLFGAISNSSVKSIARDTLQKAVYDDLEKYYEASSAVDLGPVYETISQKLEYAATNAGVVDFMSIPVNDHFEVITSSITASKGTALYNPTTKKIEWDIGDIREETVTMSYQIKVIDDMWPTTAWSSNWSSLDTVGPFGYQNEPDSGLNPVYTNSSATLNYKDPDNVNSTMEFPMPKVPVPPVLRLNIIKAINGAGLAKEFEINISGNLLNQTTMNFNHFTYGGTHKFWGLKQGMYTATENYLPYNYEKVSISAPVTISYDNPEDTITVTNKPKTTGWFYGDDEKKNYFHVGGVIVADMNFDSKKIEIAKA
ncbi:VWA domain-containing protein [Acetoanaerobium sticklandii]|uniref:VWA domain-containing protein n=1 Tax=Acetoanaerobium sticklandii TaxID=1511 RepID=UPI003A91D3B7